jgi:hypothetical protein
MQKRDAASDEEVSEEELEEGEEGEFSDSGDEDSGDEAEEAAEDGDEEGEAPVEQVRGMKMLDYCNLGAAANPGCRRLKGRCQRSLGSVFALALQQHHGSVLLQHATLAPLA